MENCVHHAPRDVCWDVAMVSAGPGVERSVPSARRNVPGSVHTNHAPKNVLLSVIEAHVKKNV